MNTDAIRVATSADWPAVERLLEYSNLPVDGAKEHIDGFVVAERDGTIKGCAALEHYGRIALLRSVAVDPSARGRGIGEQLVSHLIDSSRRREMKSLFLLTATAENWFPRFGFRVVDRASAPAALAKSAEFRGACPASAVFMSLELNAERRIDSVS